MAVGNKRNLFTELAVCKPLQELGFSNLSVVLVTCWGVTGLFEVWLFCELSRNSSSCWRCLSCDVWILQHLVSRCVWGYKGFMPLICFSRVYSLFMKTPGHRGRVVASDLDRRLALCHGFQVTFATGLFIFACGWFSCFIWLLKWGEFEWALLLM